MDAQDKTALAPPLPLVSKALNFDFASKGLNEALTSQEMAGTSGLQAIRGRVAQRTDKTNPMVREFVVASGRDRTRSDMVDGAMAAASRLTRRPYPSRCGQRLAWRWPSSPPPPPIDRR
jgi:hypothetical protein